MVRQSIVTTALLAVAACRSPKYVYGPEPAEVARGPAPANGAVLIASGGVRRISTSEGAQVDAVLVRVTVINDGARPWTIDTREQLMQTPTGVRTPPLLARSDDTSGPVITVGCGERRGIDLYYVVPPAGLVSLPSFELLWEARVGTGVVSRRTVLQRERAGAQWAFAADRPIVVLRDSPTLISQRQLRRDELR